MNEDTLNNMIRCSVCLEIYNETNRQRACITECCHQVLFLIQCVLNCVGLHSVHNDADQRSRLWRSESQRKERT